MILLNTLFQKVKLDYFRFISLQPHRNDLINCRIPFRLRHAVKLLVNLNLIEQMTKRRQPYLPFRTVKQADAVKDQPGKDLVVCYPAVVFFDGSLSISRFAPLYIAAMMAVLYAARS